MSIEAMKQALEALSTARQRIQYMLNNGEWYTPEKVVDQADEAITALRTAIEAADKSEPVAPERGTLQVGDTLYHTLGGYLMGEVEKVEPKTSYEAYKEHKRKRLEDAGFLKSPLRGAAPPADVVRDAERYRWLRDRSGKDVRSLLGVGDFTTLDAAIDEAMKG